MKTIDSTELLAQLARNDNHWNSGPAVVQHDVRLDGKKSRVDHIQLEGLTFTGMVSIQGITGGFSCILHECNFLDGLCIEALNSSQVSISKCELKWLHMWRCKLESVYIGDSKVFGSADISGLNLSNYLRLKDNELPKVELVHSSTRGRIATPAVETDDPTLAFQFRMAGIPVFMTTAGAQELMRVASRADSILTR